MEYSIRVATSEDGAAMQALLPRLAEFDVPKRRNPRHLWESDERMLLAWLDGREQSFFALVAEAQGDILGVVMVRLGEELLSHEASAHLEVIAVAREAQGLGLGKALLAQSEAEARRRGALTMTLHVFANNLRARQMYESAGFDGELLRYIKELE